MIAIVSPTHYIGSPTLIIHVASLAPALWLSPLSVQPEGGGLQPPYPSPCIRPCNVHTYVGRGRVFIVNRYCVIYDVQKMS